MMTILVSGVEHALVFYNDNNGYGLALCEEKIGPWDVGPRMDEKITCTKCQEAQAKNDEVAKG